MSVLHDPHPQPPIPTLRKLSLSLTESESIFLKNNLDMRLNQEMLNLCLLK